MTTLPPCFPEPGIAPQAPAPYFSEEAAADAAADFHRFAEIDADGVCWMPDDVAQSRLISEESLQLEKRGLTSHPQPDRGRKQPKLSQSELWKLQTTHKFTVAAKLRVQNLDNEASKLELCHSYYTVAVCGDCGKVRKFPNRCDLFFCPECAGHLQNERSKQVEWWTKTIPQPKHVVLTIRNIPDLSTGHVDELRAMFSKLRRRKFARNWRGGFYTIQVTHRNAGWHLHIHALINARWIDENQLREQWRSITNGAGYIVRVKDTRATDYLREITRYVVHGSTLAAWQPDVLATFVRAFTGKRTFGVFGDLYGKRTEFAEWIATLKNAKPRCDCGSCNVSYKSEADWLISNLLPAHVNCPRPPPPDYAQPALLNVTPQFLH